MALQAMTSQSAVDRGFLPSILNFLILSKSICGLKQWTRGPTPAGASNGTRPSSYPLKTCSNCRPHGPTNINRLWTQYEEWPRQVPHSILIITAYLITGRVAIHIARSASPVIVSELVCSSTSCTGTDARSTSGFSIYDPSTKSYSVTLRFNLLLSSPFALE